MRSLMIGVLLLSCACEELEPVHGISRRIHLTSAGDVVVPDNIDEFRVYALVPDGDGAFETIHGNGDSDGTFKIVGVPKGYYYLRVGTTLIYTDQRFIDFSSVTLGRLYFGAADGSELELHLDNLRAWQDFDNLELYADNLGYVGPSLQFGALRGAPEPGDSALRGMAIDFQDFGLPLLESSKGDRATLVQTSLTSSTAEAMTWSATRKYELGALDMINGGVTTSSGAFIEVPQTEVATIEYDPASFDAFASAIGPGAVAFGPISAWLSGLPGSREHGFHSLGSEAFRYFSATEQAVRTEHTYGNAFPDLDLWWTDIKLFEVPLQGEDSTFASFFRFEPIVPGQTLFKIEPTLSPVRNVKVGDRDAFTGGPGVGAIPVISWTVPAIGSPDVYVVELVRLEPTLRRTEAVWYTKETQMQIAPGLMHAEKKYFFRISAVAEPGFDVTRPFTESPQGSTHVEMVTAVFSP